MLLTPLVSGGWRVDIEEPEMEEALDWLEENEHIDDLGEEATTEEEDGEDDKDEDVPLLVYT
jgi:hypothetical protein